MNTAIEATFFPRSISEFCLADKTVNKGWSVTTGGGVNGGVEVGAGLPTFSVGASAEASYTKDESVSISENETLGTVIKKLTNSNGQACVNSTDPDGVSAPAPAPSEGGLLNTTMLGCLLPSMYVVYLFLSH